MTVDYLGYGRINKVDGPVANKHGANQSSKAEAGAVPAADRVCKHGRTDEPRV